MIVLKLSKQEYSDVYLANETYLSGTPYVHGMVITIQTIMVITIQTIMVIS